MAMLVGSSHFTHNQLETNFPSLQESKFSKIYKELDKSCTAVDYGEYESEAYDCSVYKISGSDDYVIDLLKKLHRNLDKIHSTVNETANGHFNDPPNDEKEYCLYLKYWFYYELVTKEDYKSQISNIFEKWKEYTTGKEANDELKHCTFHEVTFDEIEKLKSIYTFRLIFYNNIGAFNNNNDIECRYMNYFGTGLKEYYQTDENNKSQCALVIESLKNPLSLTYKKSYDRWHLSDQLTDSLKGSIISGTSAVGATVGISAFLLYLFKFTKIRSLFGPGKHMDNTMFLNMKEGSHDFTFPMLESKHSDSGYNEYKISYYSSDNS
ncbi:PIR Superfamily Protein [Plasmodium ovale wallikeri]|uniref:PIR Superfamily Protein n=1 Tax=Plasmodium ovale wallikeri TaxID=864142 RepID=A0A1A9ARJ0_PLAOA|nr:PIR Superfamily Protein [Plasmodium ovale wallikeri]SBT59323.1 PIR Superfamily Protein [Plasmodium ovale wallikeri]